MAKVRSEKFRGLVAWLPKTKPPILSRFRYCAVHGLDRIYPDSFFGIYKCSRFRCANVIELDFNKLSPIEFTIYGITNAKSE